ncbi:UNVERIFIED_CONTAM: hypothetical protein PYX00_005018 [Menopon gallinae]|uniref:Phospholipase A-2-activating protein n=1 Tax=Menopon gallinae TaxID=328185 RepID=A0AAW2I6S1_9NEOP
MIDHNLFGLVCKIAAGHTENTIFSASWDKTAKMWDLKKLEVVATFRGHGAAVWSVIQLSNGAVVTASADKNVKVWGMNGSCLTTLTGHTDCVRDLAPAGPDEFLSCSNDTTVRHWHSETGTCLNTFYGHAHFIYSISPLGSGFVTCGEDKTVKVWTNGEVTESITIPASSVWCVNALPNGDIVAGSSDGMIRVFSSDASRHASAGEIKCYKEQVENLLQGQVGSIKTSELPGVEALLQSGKKDGEVKVVNDGNIPVAYGWSEADQKWNKIGSVIGSNDSGVSAAGKPTYNGKEYDYVLSVDVEEGKPPLKLPYNKGDDPWHAAQRFIDENHLSQQFLEEVANFIIKNCDQDSSQMEMAPEFQDPFTGSARYVPQTNSEVANYKSNTSVSKSFTNNYNITSKSEYFPQREFIKFDQANLNVILEKLLEFNRKSGNVDKLVTDCEIEDLMKICEAGADCSPENILTLSRLLEWPGEIIFPVLDVMRLAIRNADVNSYLCNDELIPALMKFLSPGSSFQVPPNNMLALRVLSNMLASDAGQTLAEKNKIMLLNIIKNISEPYVKTVQVAMATLLLNVAVIIRRSETPEGRKEALAVTHQILPVLTDPEALFRALVALGTLLDNFLDSKSYTSVFRPILAKYQNDSSLGKKIQDCSQQILQIL